MKKTGILALVLVLLLAFSLTACGDKESRTPIEIMKASMAKQWDVKSAHSLMKANMAFDVPEALVTPDQKMIMDALKDASVELEAIMDTEAGKGHIRAELKAAGGVNFSGEAFVLSENEMVLSTPLVPQQVLINLTDLKAIYEKETGQIFPDISFMNTKAAEEFKPLMDTALDFVGDIIKGEKSKITFPEVEFSTGKEKITTVTFSYKGEEVLPALLRMAENAVNSDNLVKYMEQTIEVNKKMGLDMGHMNIENLKQELARAKEEFSKNKDQAEKMIGAYLKFKNLEFSFGVDKQDLMRTSNFNLELEVINPFDPENKIPMKLEMSAVTDQYGAVKVEDIKTTTVDPANSIKIEDMMNQVK